MPTIIFINGTLSSGKTSLLKLLQKNLPEPYLDMSVDKFIWMLPSRYLDRPLWDEVLGKALQAGPVGWSLFSGMHHAIAAAASRGNNILADHVFVEKSWVDECAELFGGMNAFLIGLQCPLEVLEQREKDRKDRTLGQARLQYDVIHKYTKYDLELDTSVLSIEECADRIIQRIKTPPTAFKQLR
ncbi:MAG: chloramphenicol phosphotransferase [Chloroflexi bacterium]|nr:chloramphenicol phosphotransferase [Chloroflexota bacterium]MDL1940796.1 chloramphenicol phosphotransferase [Chloroflexi bacterium CFX2]